MTQFLEDLKAIRELLSVPERWTQGTGARNELGYKVAISNDQAVCWCIDGAAVKVTTRGGGGGGSILRYEALVQAFAYIHPDFVWWNDAPERTHAEVLALLDKAIDIARAEGR